MGNNHTQRQHSILMCYGRTPYTPGRYLEHGLRKIGVEVTVVEDMVDFSKIDMKKYQAVLFVESPARPKIQVKHIQLATLPKLFWIHHGENRLSANLEMCHWYKPDLLLMSHSLHLAHHFPAPVRFFPFGLDPHIFNSSKKYSQRKYDVSFVGGRSSIYQEREIRLKLIELLLQDRATLSMKENIYLEQLSQLYGNSRMVFNQTADHIKSFNMRIFEGMGCGALILTDMAPEQEMIFEDRVHYVIYDSRTDMLVKLDYYLTHPEEAERIALHGQQYIQQHHTYAHRAHELLDWIGKLS